MTDTAILAIAAAVPTVTSVIGSATVIIAQMFREGRQRRWDEEDRMRLEKERQASTASLESAHAALAATVVQEQARATESRTAIAAAIAENTDLTKQATQKATEAYHEANSVNLKIAALGLERVQADRRDRRETDGPQPIKVEVVNTPLVTTVAPAASAKKG